MWSKQSVLKNTVGTVVISVTEVWFLQYAVGTAEEIVQRLVEKASDIDRNTTTSGKIQGEIVK